jgi:hypothetical protein
VPYNYFPQSATGLNYVGYPTGPTATPSTITSGGGANVKGSYTEIASSTGFTCNRMLFRVVNTMGTAGRQFLFDVATGAGGAEVVLVPNLSAESGTSVGAALSWERFPVSITSGTRIAVRCQASGAGGQTARVAITLESAGDIVGVTAAWGNYGVDTTTSSLTSVDPGGSANTKGSYAQITASTSAVIQPMCLMLGQQANTAPTGTFWLVDLATGAAASEVVLIPDSGAAIGGSAGEMEPRWRMFLTYIPASTRIAARASCLTTDATDRIIGVALTAAAAPTEPDPGIQRVTQLVMLYGYNRYEEADPPPDEDVCTGGGTVASGSNPSAGTSLATATAPHLVFRITVDGTTYDFAKTAINWGTEKQPRIDKVGRYRRALMDRQGGIELPSVWVDFIDYDNLMRGWHENETLHGLTGQFLVADETTWRAGGANADVRFSGEVTDFRPLPNQRYRLELESPLTHAFAANKEMQLPRDTLSVTDGTADQGLRRSPARALYGSLNEDGGAIELPFIGTQTPVGHPELGNRHRHFFCRGAIHNITAVFRGDPLSGDPPTTRTAAQASEYESDILAPHISGANWYESELYTVVDDNRWTFLDLDQNHPAANVARFGRIPLTANVCGRETVGDGTGSTINSAPWQLVHVLNNELLSVVADADWASQAARNGFSIIDKASADAVKTAGENLLAGGLRGAFELGFNYQFITTREFLAQAYISWGIETFINRYGQIAFTILDRSATASGVPTDTAVFDILKGSFSIDPHREDIENATRYVYRRNYVKSLQQLDNPEGTRLPREPFDADFLSGVQEVTNATSVTALGGTPRGRRESDVLQMELTREEAVATAVMALRNAIRSPANGRATATYSITLQKADDVELGDLRKVTHPWGTSSTGWSARRCQVRAITEDWNDMTAELEVLDVEDLLDEVAVEGIVFGGNPLTLNGDPIVL